MIINLCLKFKICQKICLNILPSVLWMQKPWNILHRMEKENILVTLTSNLHVKISFIDIAWTNFSADLMDALSKDPFLGSTELFRKLWCDVFIDMSLYLNEITDNKLDVPESCFCLFIFHVRRIKLSPTNNSMKTRKIFLFYITLSQRGFWEFFDLNCYEKLCLLEK